MAKPIRDGSGKDKKQRLSVPLPPTGNADGLVTAKEMQEFMRALGIWADNLTLARLGWHVTGLHSALNPIPTTPTPVSFSRRVEDSSRYTHNQNSPLDLTYFEVPAGQGGVYNVTWQLNFQKLELVTTTFTSPGKTTGQSNTQHFTVPSDIYGTDLTITCNGSGGQQWQGSYPGGKGAQVKGTITTAPGTVYDVYAGTAGNQRLGGYPNGGTSGGATSAGGGGGGRSEVRPSGGAAGSHYIIAGAGGGEGYGANGMGGDGRFTVGQSGVGTTADPTPVSTGGSQSAGGQCASGGFPPGNGGSLFGGTFASGDDWGGGGDGFFGGGMGVRVGFAAYASSGGGGSSNVSGAVRAVSHTDGLISGDGSVVFTYYRVIALTPGDMVCQVLVKRANFENLPPYSYIEQISSDTGYSPLHGAINVTLDPGDRVYMQTSTGVSGYSWLGDGTRLSVFLVGN